MNFFQKWVVNTLKTEDVKDVLAKRLNELEPIKKRYHNPGVCPQEF